MEKGDQVWYAMTHGKTVVQITRVKILGKVDWAPGIYVKSLVDSKTLNVSLANLIPIETFDEQLDCVMK